MSLRATDLADLVARAKAAMATLEKELNAADARIGDGDTGTMLARVVDRMAKADTAAAADMGAAFAGLAKAAATATGSSLGTLLATALLAISRETKGMEAVDPTEWAALAVLARDAVVKRGGAAPGDKTVVDSLDCVAGRLAGDAPGDLGAAVASAAEDALAGFREKPNRIGRARMFGDKTVGLDDPGMLAFARIARALVDR
ncbi:DAK2 domain-containing protein [Propylenella binzhouense]|uniref:DAK2 domain-containing protein n=1 Tax=Propylenella binzhouense TaxID=2555902 RepID=A0A964WSP9_9HYPH|nr:DAK2 domain-containing protein [Propylenella binzhouense]MYZ47030.1 DAK2 domain-containing protein [Propylenella binzhouense]